MDKKQISRLNSYRRMVALLAENNSIFQDFDMLAEEVENLNFYVSQLEADAGLQLAGVNIDVKNSYFKALENVTSDMCGKAWTWATRTADVEMRALFDFNASDFNIPEAQCITLAENIYHALQVHKDALIPYRIRQLELEKFRKAIDDAELHKATAQNERARIRVAGSNLRTLQERIDTSLDMIGRLLQSEYRLTQPNLINTFLATRVPDAVNTRHTTLHGLVKDAAGNPLAHARCTLSGNGRTHAAESNSSGFYEFKEFRSGEYTLQVSLAGYQPLTKAIDIGLGQTLELDVTLSAES